MLELLVLIMADLFTFFKSRQLYTLPVILRCTDFEMPQIFVKLQQIEFAMEQTTLRIITIGYLIGNQLLKFHASL